MTMHLLQVRNVSTRKTKAKPTKKQLAEWDSEWKERNKWLKSLGMATLSYQQFIDQKHGRGEKQKPKYEPLKTEKAQHRETPRHPSLATTLGPCTKAPPKVYTGTAIVGIGTMHKSNSVPIFSKDEAHDIATMRRS